MFTEADRIRAIELYFKYGRKITAVIRELGYPTERNLRRWVRAWEASGGDISCLPRKESTDAAGNSFPTMALAHGLPQGLARAGPSAKILSAGKIISPVTGLRGVSHWIHTCIRSERSIFSVIHAPRCQVT